MQRGNKRICSMAGGGVSYRLRGESGAGRFHPYGLFIPWDVFVDIFDGSGHFVLDVLDLLLEFARGLLEAPQEFLVLGFHEH